MQALVSRGIAYDSQNQEVEFEFKEGLDIKRILDMQQAWMTDFYSLLQSYKVSNPNVSNEDAIKNCNMEDGFWNWIKKASVLTSNEYLWFSLEKNSQIESIVVVYHPKKSICTGLDIFYVDFFAVAPWNRKSALREPVYRGLGTLMLKLVGKHINDIYGYDGGFSLHSLPNAIGFYKRIGMTDFGVDAAKENLHYLEMKSSEARGFYNA